MGDSSCWSSNASWCFCDLSSIESANFSAFIDFSGVVSLLFTGFGFEETCAVAAEVAVTSALLFFL
jgi:hypothetical protein